MLLRRNAYPAGKKHRTRYKLTWSLAKQSEVDTLLGLFNGGGTITWTPPGGSAGSYIIENNTINVTQTGSTKSLSLTLEEV